MRHRYIQLLFGGFVMVNMASCSPDVSFPLNHAVATSLFETPMVKPMAPSPTATPAAALRPQEASTPLWTAVPITQTQPGDMQEKPIMTGVPVPAPFDPALQQLVMQAEQDLARRLTISVEQIQLVEVQSVTWPDKGLGCPQPGMVYTQVQVDGLLIRLRAGNRLYEYHSGGNRAPFLCEQPAGGRPGEDYLAPPPGLGTQ
jgi:hypothetical protein